MHYWGDGSWGWGAWLVMSMLMLGFWALVAWVIVTIVRGASGPRSHAPSAEDILAERYARGEIDENEYFTRRDTLRSKR